MRHHFSFLHQPGAQLLQPHICSRLFGDWFRFRQFTPGGGDLIIQTLRSPPLQILHLSALRQELAARGLDW
jgi:hypothetical protein